LCHELAIRQGQAVDLRAGLLFADGAQGGPLNLSRQNYYPGINDLRGKDPSGSPLNSTVFSL
jgi:hypothetical protein